VPIPINGGGRNFLETIATHFYNLATEMDKLYVQVVGWILPFKLLAFPFRWSRDYYRAAARAIIDFSHKYGDVTDFITSLMEGWGLDDLITDLWHGWRYFRTDPGRFIGDVMGQAVTGWATLVSFPFIWILDTIKAGDPELFAWLVDFPKEFTRWAQLNHPSFYNLLFDKKAFVTDIIDEFSWPIAYLIRDFDGAKRYLGELYLELPYSFWDDPWGVGVQKLFDWIDDHDEWIAARVYKPAERILRYLWEGG